MLSEVGYFWHMKGNMGRVLRAASGLWLGALAVKGVLAVLATDRLEGWTKLTPLPIENADLLAGFLLMALPFALVSVATASLVTMTIRRRVSSSARRPAGLLGTVTVVWATLQVLPAALFAVSLSDFRFRDCDQLGFASFPYTADCSDAWTALTLSAGAWLVLLAGFTLIFFWVTR